MARARACVQPGRKTGFVTNQLSHSLSIIDSASRTVKSTIPLGKKPNGIVYRAR